MRRVAAVVGGVLGVALVGYALLAGKSDEELILERLDALDDAIRIDSESSTNPVLRAGAIRGRFDEIFTADVRYQIPELSSGGGRQELATLAARSGMVFGTLDVDFGTTDIQVTEGTSTASVDTVATLTGTRRGERIQRDDRNVRFELLETDDGWRITDVRVSANLVAK